MVVNYYKEELIGWDAALVFYEKELLQLQVKLVAIIRLNTIPERATKAEDYLNQFTVIHSHFNSISKDIYKQQLTLLKDNVTIEDVAVTSEISISQDEIREKMKLLERKFIDLKYLCHIFLSQTYKQ